MSCVKIICQTCDHEIVEPSDVQIEEFIKNEMCEACGISFKVDDYWCDDCEYEMKGYYL